MTQNRARAILTRYKGYAFRSRTEARWAIFFDHLKIRWEYEPEGFELGNGLRYLPDFWLPDWKMWVEIKPDAPDDPALEKAYRLAHLSEHPVYITHGLPDAGGTFVFVEVAQGGEVSLLSSQAWAPWTDSVIYVNGPTPCEDFPILEAYPVDHLDTDLIGAAEDALHAARSARFEFGQKGAV